VPFGSSPVVSKALASQAATTESKSGASGSTIVNGAARSRLTADAAATRWRFDNTSLAVEPLNE
jgi:hypothetical protein